MDGYPALRIDTTYELNGKTVKQITVTINANALYNCNFTDTGDVWSYDYETAIAEMQLMY